MIDSNLTKEEVDANAIRPVMSKVLRSNSDAVMELAFERREVSDKLARLNKVITMNPEAVSEHHKELWRKQAEAMQAYKDVLGERIKDLIDI